MKFATLVISAGLLAAPAFADSCSSKKDATHRVDASYTTAVAGEGYTKAKADIVDTAAAAGSFSTLLAAAEAAGLVGALKGDGPLTVLPRPMRLLQLCRLAPWKPCFCQRTKTRSQAF